MESVIFHIDVNSAFLSWTAVNQLKQGATEDIRSIPSIIGGDMEKRHGIVLAKSVPAKKYHIKTGEPIVNALRKCPGLVIVPPNHEMYQDYSHELFLFLSDICPDLEQASIDECYMDYTPISANYPSPVDAAISIKDRIYKTFGFTVNIGISDKKVLAKMASDFQKPNLVHTLFSYEIADKMWHLPVENLYMCGSSSVKALHNLGIATIGDLAKTDAAILEMHLKSHGRLLWEYANGIDDSKVELVQAELKGIGNSITLKEDALTKQDAFPALLHLAETVGTRLRKHHRLAGMISVEIKYSTFQSVSHQMTLETPTDSTDFLYESACRLFLEIWNHTPIRLLGIRTSKLSCEEAPVQLNLFDYGSQSMDTLKKQKAEKAIDSIRDKFGSDAVVRGSLLNRKDSYQKH